MPRSPLTESVNKVRRLLTEIRTMLTEDEYNLLLDELVPEPTPLKPQKKSSKKGVGKGGGGKSKLANYVSCLQCGAPENDTTHRDKTAGAYHHFQPSSSKSARASGMAAQLSNRRTETSQRACGAALPSNGEACNRTFGDPLHDGTAGYADFHPFVQATPVRNVGGELSANNAGDGSGASSVTGKDAVSNVHHAGG